MSGQRLRDRSLQLGIVSPSAWYGTQGFLFLERGLCLTIEAAQSSSPTAFQPRCVLLPMCPLPERGSDSLLAQNKGPPLSPNHALLPPHPRHPRCHAAHKACWMPGKAWHRCPRDGTSGPRVASSWWDLGHHEAATSPGGWVALRGLLVPLSVCSQNLPGDFF